MFTYTVFYFMIQYYGNENFDENNEVWKFWQIDFNKCDWACENRAYLHTKFSLIFKFQLTISFEVQMLLQ